MNGISGLISGLDTQSLIDALLGSSKQRLQSLQDQKTALSFRRDTYSGLSGRLYALDDAAAKLRMSSVMLARQAESSAPALVGCTASSTATRGSWQINVSSLARAARVESNAAAAFLRTDQPNTLGLASVEGVSEKEGAYDLSATSGRGGTILGRVTGLRAEATLAELGVTDATGFSVQTTAGQVTLTGLSTSMKLSDFVLAVNKQASSIGVGCELRGGSLLLESAQGNRDIVASAGQYAGSVASALFGLTEATTSTAAVRGRLILEEAQTLASLGISSTAGFAVQIGGTRTALTVGTGETVADLVSELEALDGLRARLVGGQLQLSAELPGIDFELLDTEYSQGVAACALGLQGPLSTAGPTRDDCEVVGARSGAAILGQISGLQSGRSLASLGVTDSSGFTLALKEGKAWTLELATSDTVGDLLEAIEATGSFSAQLIDGRVALYSADGGVDFSITDSGFSGTLASQIFGLSEAVSTWRDSSSLYVTPAEAGSRGNLVSLREGLTTATTLTSLGITSTTGFTVATGSQSITLDLSSCPVPTVGDLIEAFRDQTTFANARIVGGRLRLETSQGGAELAISDSDYSDGIARRLFGAEEETWNISTIFSERADLAVTTTLGALGVTDFSDVWLGSRGENKALQGLASGTTVQQLIDALDALDMGLEAKLLDVDGDGTGQFVIRSTRVHEQFVLGEGETGGLGEALFGTKAQLNTGLAGAEWSSVAGASTGACVLGAPDLTEATTLGSLGITSFAGFHVVVKGADYNLEGLGSASTVADLITQLNALPGVSAGLVQGHLKIGSSDPRAALSLTDTNYDTGLAAKLLGLTSATSTANSAEGNTLLASASTGAVTLAALFTTGADKGALAGVDALAEGESSRHLLAGVTLTGRGADGLFTVGKASLITTAELNGSVPSGARIYGAVAGSTEGYSATTAAAGNSSTQTDWEGAVSAGAEAGVYELIYDDAGNWAVFNAEGERQGEWVASGERFVSWLDSSLAGSSFVHLATAPAEGDSWGFQVKLDAHLALPYLGLASPASEASNGFFTINNKRIYIEDYQQESLASVIAKINSAGAEVAAAYNPATNSIELVGEPGTEITLGSTKDTSNMLAVFGLTQSAGATSIPAITSTGLDLSKSLSLSGMTLAITAGTFTLGGVTLYVDPETDTLDDLVQRINSSSAGVHCGYDSNSDSFWLEATGESIADGARLGVGSRYDTSNVLQALRLVGEMPQSPTSVGAAASWAVYEMNGVEYRAATNTVTEAIPGLTLEFKGTTTSQVTLTVSDNTEQALDALASFLAAYNSTIDLACPAQLTDEDEEYLAALSDTDRESMTESEIDEYNARHEEIMQREEMRKSSVARRLASDLRSVLSGTVAGLEEFPRLKDLGIDFVTWGQDGFAGRGYLVQETTDEDALRTALQANSTLMAALSDNPEAVLSLLSQSGYTGNGHQVIGTRQLEGAGLQLPSGGGALSFRLGDSAQWSNPVTLAAGATYTEDQILQLLDNAGLYVGDEDQATNRIGLAASFVDGRLVLTALNSTGSVYLEDLSQGSNNLERAFGVKVEFATAGLARQIDDVLTEYNSSTGLLRRKLLSGGEFARESDLIESRLESTNDLLEAQTRTLWLKFNAMESALSRLQTQSNYLSQQLASLSG